MELDAELQKIVKRFGLEYPGYDPDIPATYFGGGSAGPLFDIYDFNQWVRNNLTTGWYMQEMWSDGGFREVWWNREKQAIITYCEGDVDMTVDWDTEVFDKRWKSAEEFYAKH